MYTWPSHVQEKVGGPPVHGFSSGSHHHQDSSNEGLPHTGNAQQPKIMTTGLIFMGSMENLGISV